MKKILLIFITLPFLISCSFLSVTGYDPLEKYEQYDMIKIMDISEYVTGYNNYSSAQFCNSNTILMNNRDELYIYSISNRNETYVTNYEDITQSEGESAYQDRIIITSSSGIYWYYPGDKIFELIYEITNSNQILYDISPDGKKIEGLLIIETNYIPYLLDVETGEMNTNLITLPGIPCADGPTEFIWNKNYMVYIEPVEYWDQGGYVQPSGCYDPYCPQKMYFTDFNRNIVHTYHVPLQNLRGRISENIYYFAELDDWGNYIIYQKELRHGESVAFYDLATEKHIIVGDESTEPLIAELANPVDAVVETFVDVSPDNRYILIGIGVNSTVLDNGHEMPDVLETGRTIEQATGLWLIDISSLNLKTD